MRKRSLWDFPDEKCAKLPKANLAEKIVAVDPEEHVATDKQIRRFTIQMICKEQGATFARRGVAKLSGVEPRVIARGHVGGVPRKRS